MKNITLKWLSEQNACNLGIEWFKGNNETNTQKIFKSLLKYEKLDYANWLVSRLLTQKQKIRYAIFAAEQVRDLFEKQYPNDPRCRNAIKAAKLVLKRNNLKNRNAAYAAADAAAYAAADAAYAAAYAANAAAYAAAYAAADAANAAMKTKIILFGIDLLKRSHKI